MQFTKKWLRRLKGLPKTLQGYVKEMETDPGDGILFCFWDALKADIGRKVPAIGNRQIELSHYSVRPKCPGVYIVYSDESKFEYLYVGQSGNIRSRISGSHPGVNRPFAYIQVDDEGERLMIEQRCIKALRPTFNYQTGR